MYVAYGESLSAVTLTPWESLMQPRTVNINALARATGMSAAHVSRVLRGLTGVHLETAVRLAEALDMSLDEFHTRIQKGLLRGQPRP